jgi:hypothetical protein
MRTRKDRIRTFRFIHNAFVLIALAALSACSRAPAPQQDAAFVTVVSADGHELRDSFNRDAGKTRLLLFLSPT